MKKIKTNEYLYGTNNLPSIRKALEARILAGEALLKQLPSDDFERISDVVKAIKWCIEMLKLEKIN